MIQIYAFVGGQVIYEDGRQIPVQQYRGQKEPLPPQVVTQVVRQVTMPRREHCPVASAMGVDRRPHRPRKWK